jgi:NAD(P)-dependent dehydrogenase (short-subunit alcohol dehydrogenase family)
MTDELAGVPPEIVERFHLDKMPFAQKDAAVSDLVSLAGKRALVTGGGGVGLGQATCNRLAGQGADVIVFDLDGDAAKQVASDVEQRWGTKAIPVQGSVHEWGDAQRVVGTAVAQLGGLDIFVSNAGGLAFNQFGPFIERSQSDIDEMLDLNLKGVMYCTHAALEVMVPQGSGRVVLVSSEGGKIGMRDLVVYNSCKSGIIGFGRNLAHELEGTGVSIVGVAPGIMMSDVNLDVMRSGIPGAAEAIADAFVKTTIDRCSLPEEVANVIAFLCSDAGSYIHATTVSVGGGMSD